MGKGVTTSSMPVVGAWAFWPVYLSPQPQKIQEPTHITGVMTNQEWSWWSLVSQTKNVWSWVNNSGLGIRQHRVTSSLGCDFWQLSSAESLILCWTRLTGFQEIDTGWLETLEYSKACACLQPTKGCGISSQQKLKGPQCKEQGSPHRDSQCYPGACSGVRLKKQVNFGDGEGQCHTTLKIPLPPLEASCVFRDGSVLWFNMVRQRERIKIHRLESLTGRMSYRSEWRTSRAFRDWFLNLGLLLALKRANELLFLSHRFDCCSGEPASLEITTQQFRLSLAPDLQNRP